MSVLAHFPLRQRYPRYLRAVRAVADGCPAMRPGTGAAGVCGRPCVSEALDVSPGATLTWHMNRLLAWPLLFPKSCVIAVCGFDMPRAGQDLGAKRHLKQRRLPGTRTATRTAIKTRNADDDTTLIDTRGRQPSADARRPCRHRSSTRAICVERADAAHRVARLDSSKNPALWPAFPFSFFHCRSFRNDGSKMASGVTNFCEVGYGDDRV